MPKTHLRRTHLRRTHLRQTHLRQTHLRRTHLRQTHLRRRTHLPPLRSDCSAILARLSTPICRPTACGTL
ncbi:pentapeptide repeat-containing protein [Paraburkholderia graminis]|uniref:pentapeptide repeat-containing protein n=1 Tax=Paraburkholderia graminis TaxID=60548 RepID=UPI0012F48AAB